MSSVAARVTYCKVKKPKMIRIYLINEYLDVDITIYCLQRIHFFRT